MTPTTSAKVAGVSGDRRRSDPRIFYRDGLDLSRKDTMGTTYGIRVASYPDPDRDTESWVETLTEYDGGGLARADRAHEHELLAAGWRIAIAASADTPATWEEPAAKRRRRSIEEVAVVLRTLVNGLDPRRMPSHVPRPVVKAALGIVEAIGCLLFFATTDEALRSRFALPRRRHDPTRARFRRTGDVLALASAPSTTRLGMGSPTYRIAESRGRTRARWDEVECRATHVSSGGIAGLHQVEAKLDAQKAIASARLSEADAAGLRDWLDEGAAPDERVRRYRRRLADPGVYSHHAPGEHEDLDRRARLATTNLTDRAILERLTRARAALERHLAALPPKAEALALETGELAFLATLVAPRREKPAEPRPRRERRPVERIALHAPRCL